MFVRMRPCAFVFAFRRVCEPHARPASAVHLDELDAADFQRLTDGSEGAAVRLGLATLKPRERLEAHPSHFGDLFLRPIKQGTSRTRLSGRNR